MILDIDVSVVMQEAFHVSKANAEELSNVSLNVKGQKVKLEEAIRVLLGLLCDMNVVDINLEKMTEIGWIEAGKLADRATVLLPSNRVERLAIDLKELDPETTEQVVDYLDAATRRRLIIALEID